MRAPVSTLSGDTSWCLNICAFSHVDQIYVHMKPVALLEPETIKIANTKEQSKNHPCENENWCYFASAKTNVPKHQDLVKLDTNAPFSDSFGHSFHCPNLWKCLLLWHVSRNLIIWHLTFSVQPSSWKVSSFFPRSQATKTASRYSEAASPVALHSPHLRGGRQRSQPESRATKINRTSGICLKI